ncbi:hypothetical protein GUY61_32725 [Streptomyces sp. GC420]|nr:hypothetical protein [Streptomyces sp. GC420]
MCAGSYLDDTYRDAVIEELYVHEERIVAPSLGFDAARVLAHALRARRLELGWAAAILLLWIVSLPVTGYLTAMFMTPVLLLTIAGRVRGTGERPPWYRRATALFLRWYGRLFLLYVLLTFYAVAREDYDSLENVGDLSLLLLIPREALYEILAESGRGQAWAALAFPLLGAAVVALQRGQFARALSGELSRTRFPDAASDPAERAESGRFQRLRDSIRVEQHAPLVMYRAADPFCGAGTPYDPWSLSVELRPRGDLGTRKAQPLDNREVLNRIVPLLEALREPAAGRTAQAAAAVRDRLRELEIDECVFLPVDGLPSRRHAPYAPEMFEQHRARAVEEGGETRRHFLRVRVGGWGEEVVTTVYVRVHTQGGMLMLEVAPHVLRPVRPLFRNADRLAHQYLHNSLFGKAVWALSHTPGSAGQAVVTLWRGAAFLWRLATGGYGVALPDGPAVSVRELGSDDDASLFQEMDHSRYLKSIQDRVANGVRQALRDAGWQTDEFEQKIINVSNGGVFIESAQGAIGIGANNTITNKAPISGGDSGNG